MFGPEDPAPKVGRWNFCAGQVLGLSWSKLNVSNPDVQGKFVPLVVKPIRALASETIDASAIFGGLLLPGSISDKVAGAYRKHLFGTATLQNLPDDPRFVINATNVQSGALWRFMKPAMRDYRVGEVKEPKIELAVAVAASSAFPPVLSPLTLELDPVQFTPGSGTTLQRPPFTSRVVLTDGGVYDNLGLETAWKRYKTILVSDGGGQMSPEEEPKHDWPRHAYRVLNIIDNQVRSLRKRQLIGSFIDKIRTGTYWGIRTNILDYSLPDYPLVCPHEKTIQLSQVATRLKRLDDKTQEKLIDWGYAVCDAALRAHTKPEPQAPKQFPYGIGVG